MTPSVTNKIATLKDFKGLWARGSNDDCPLDHLTVCNNCIFKGRDVNAREGLDAVFFASTIHSITCTFVYSASVKQVTADINHYPILYLDSGGSLYDGSTHPNTLLHNFGNNCSSFSAIELAGRVFISPKSLSSPLIGDFTYYWDGTHFRKLAGIGAAAPVTLAQVGAGIISAGVHGIAISFEYQYGYLSPPSPITNITSTGSNDIEISNIPLGGDGVVARVILMTVANETELFFVPSILGGRIPDNTTTTATINLADSALLSSADYLNDVKPTIPSCTSIRFYRGRTVFIGCDDFKFIIKLSNVQDFETINSVTNTINTPRDSLNNFPNTALIINNILYILKPYGTYSVEDNGLNPGSWPLTIADAALGGYDTGVSIIPAGLSGIDVLDISLIVHPRGLLLFNGTYSDIPLSYKIDDLWRSQVVTPGNNGTFQATHVANDIINKRLYIAPFGGPWMMMDYSEGLTPQSVKWSVWTTGLAIAVSDINCFFDQNNNYIVLLCFGSQVTFSSGLYTLNPLNVGFDYVNNVNLGFTQIISSPLLSAAEGGITTFTGLRFRVNGIGVMGITLFNESGAGSAVPTGFNLTGYSGVDLFRGINFVNEKMQVQLTSVGVATINLNRLDVFGSKMWATRPVLTQTA